MKSLKDKTITEGGGETKRFPLKFDTESFKKRLAETHPHLELVGEYGKDNDDFITVRCIKHDTIIKTTPHRLNANKFCCKRCYFESRSEKIREKKSAEFMKFLQENYAAKYDISHAKYVNSNTKVALVCPKHGTFYLTPNKIMSRHDGCPLCHESKLERNMAHALDEINVCYERQKTFPWLKGKGHMFLDFFIADKSIAIECQGEQHFDERYGTFLSPTDKDFAALSERDRLKKMLCEEHGIKMIYVVGCGNKFADKAKKHLGEYVKVQDAIVAIEKFQR